MTSINLPLTGLGDGASDARAPVSSEVLDAAIHWQLRLGAGDATEADRDELEKWLAEYPDHQRAWNQLAVIDQGLSIGTGTHMRALLSGKKSARRRSLVTAALVLAVGIPSVLLVLDRFEPVAHLAADYRTGTGEIKTISLPDHTLLRMNTRSAVDLAFDEQRRAIVLRQGEIEVETSHDNPAETRPFIVLTPDGSLRALGTRFIVRRVTAGDDPAVGTDATRVIVTRSAVAVRPATCSSLPQIPCAEEKRVEQGESLLLAPDRLGVIETAPAQADAWKDGMLVIDNQPLSSVVREIARYRPGYLSVAPEVASQRITGTLPLRDTDKALLALTAAAPVEVLSATRWWTRLQGHQPGQDKK